MIRVDARPMDYVSGIRGAQDKKEVPQEQKEVKAAKNNVRKPDMDQYIPEKGSDSPEADGKKVGQPEAKPDGDNLKNKDSGKKTEKCTGNTDKVDREIEKLKKRKKELESQLRTVEDEGKRKSLESQLAQVERELRQKDNDGYRRQHTVFS
ncbi:hypothetical protein D7X87_02655 [bacterium D16-54]|nr:hypothetical protein D7X87_02655 [bacterium D16-54]RKJ16538.1 hypothetical protein D7X65_02655 [bacterium D16-56]